MGSGRWLKENLSFTFQKNATQSTSTNTRNSYPKAKLIPNLASVNIVKFYLKHQYIYFSALKWDYNWEMLRHVSVCACVRVFAPSSVALTEWEQLWNDHSCYHFPPINFDMHCIEHRHWWHTFLSCWLCWEEAACRHRSGCLQMVGLRQLCPSCPCSPQATQGSTWIAGIRITKTEGKGSDDSKVANFACFTPDYTS